MTRHTIREAAESLRSELERELDPNVYQTAWERGSGEEVEDVITRIVAELEAERRG